MTNHDDQFETLYEQTKSFGYSENEYPSAEIIAGEQANKKAFKKYVDHQRRSAVRECLERLLTTYSLKSREAYKLHRRFDFDTEIKAELKKLGEE